MKVISGVRLTSMSIVSCLVNLKRFKPRVTPRMSGVAPPCGKSHLIFGTRAQSQITLNDVHCMSAFAHVM